MSKTKFYVVWEGREPGIYENWAACKKQIFKFERAKFKSFDSKSEAEIAYLEGHKNKYNNIIKNTKTLFENIENQTYIHNSISADAACSGNPGPMEYRIVETSTGKELYRSPVYPEGTVNIGEFLAIVHSLAMLKEKNSNLPIYSDSKIAIKWVNNKIVKTKLNKTETNSALFKIIDRALEWLQNNSWENQILKWHTSIWGEIPADFGRKNKSRY